MDSLKSQSDWTTRVPHVNTNTVYYCRARRRCWIRQNCSDWWIHVYKTCQLNWINDTSHWHTHSHAHAHTMDRLAPAWKKSSQPLDLVLLDTVDVTRLCRHNLNLTTTLHQLIPKTCRCKPVTRQRRRVNIQGDWTMQGRNVTTVSRHGLVCRLLVGSMGHSHQARIRPVLLTHTPSWPLLVPVCFYSVTKNLIKGNLACT